MNQLELEGAAAWAVNETGQTCRISSMFSDMLGTHEAEMLGERWSEWIHADDYERHMESWRIAFALRRQFMSVFRMWDGTGYIQLVTMGEPIYRDGVFTGYVGLVRRLVKSQHQKSTDYARPA